MRPARCCGRRQIGIPAARLGLGYGYGGVENLERLVGPARAADILFTARRLDAAEALQIGLVNRVVAVDDLDSAVRDLAGTIAANAPLTVRTVKAALREVCGIPTGATSTLQDMVEACFRSEDYREGQQAFMEKRPPQFKGR